MVNLVLFVADSLVENTTLTSLGLRDNNVGPEGMRAFAVVLKKNTALNDVQLKGNNIQAQGMSAPLFCFLEPFMVMLIAFPL